MERLNKAKLRAEAALAGVDECTEALATVRSGEYLRMAPCAPKRGYYDQQLVPASDESSAAKALGSQKFGPSARFYLLEAASSSFTQTRPLGRRRRSLAAATVSSVNNTAARAPVWTSGKNEEGPATRRRWRRRSRVLLEEGQQGEGDDEEGSDDQDRGGEGAGVEPYESVSSRTAKSDPGLELDPTLVGCYFERALGRGADPAFDDLDDRLTPNLIENLADYWLLRALRRHPRRTFDPARASVVVIGYPIYLSYLIGNAVGVNGRSACKGGILSHYERMERLSKALEKHPLWQRRNGADFFVALTSKHLTRVLGPTLKATLEKGPVMLGTGDRQFHPDLEPASSKFDHSSSSTSSFGQRRRSLSAHSNASTHAFQRGGGGGGRGGGVAAKGGHREATAAEAAAGLQLPLQIPLDFVARLEAADALGPPRRGGGGVGGGGHSRSGGKDTFMLSASEAADERSVLMQRAVVIPLKGHFLLDEAASAQPNGYHTNKTTSFFFQGRISSGGASSSKGDHSKKRQQRRGHDSSPTDSGSSSSFFEFTPFDGASSLLASSSSNDGRGHDDDGWGDGAYREAALGHFQNLFPTAQVHNVDVTQVWAQSSALQPPKKRSSSAPPAASTSTASSSLLSSPATAAALKRLSRSTVQEFLRARFCLVPAGESPISRRLYDALAAGCIPIVAAPFEAVCDSLPFRASVPWSEIAIFAGDLKCFAQHLRHGTRNWLDGLLTDDLVQERRLSCMRRRGQQAFARHLSYRVGGGLVDALLSELDDQGKLVPPLVMPEELIRSSSSSSSAFSEGQGVDPDDADEDDDGAAVAALASAGFASAAADRVRQNEEKRRRKGQPGGPPGSSGGGAGRPVAGLLGAGAVAVDGVRVNPFTAAALNLKLASANQANNHRGWGGGDPLRSSAAAAVGSQTGEEAAGGVGLLSSKEKQQLQVQALVQQAREELSNRLLVTEGFQMLGTFEDWQGVGGEAVAVRHHTRMRRPLLFCTLPFVADHSFRQLLRRASGVADWRHDENDDVHFGADTRHESSETRAASSTHHGHHHGNHHHHDGAWSSLTIKHGGRRQHREHSQNKRMHSHLHGLDLVGLRHHHHDDEEAVKDWGDVASVFGSHTNPPFFKATVVRDPVTRLLAVYLAHCHHEEDGRSGGDDDVRGGGGGGGGASVSSSAEDWDTCHPPRLSTTSHSSSSSSSSPLAAAAAVPSSWSSLLQGNDAQDDGRHGPTPLTQLSPREVARAQVNTGSGSPLTPPPLWSSNASSSTHGNGVISGLEEFIERLEAAVKPFQNPKLRQQIDQCGLKFVRYDAIGRFERFVPDSRKLLLKAGIWDHTHQHYDEASGAVALTRPEVAESRGGREGKRKIQKKKGKEKKRAGVETDHWWQSKASQRETAEGEHVASLVCEHFTPALLARTHALYSTDFEFFGYNVSTWHDRCTGTWIHARSSVR